MRIEQTCAYRAPRSSGQPVGRRLRVPTKLSRLEGMGPCHGARCTRGCNDARLRRGDGRRPADFAVDSIAMVIVVFARGEDETRAVCMMEIDRIGAEAPSHRI